MWLALPPAALGYLAWVAPLPWISLVLREKLAGRYPYVIVWLGGLAFWLGAIHWVRLPHPATYLGWFALSLYLSFYTLAFVALSRVAVHRVRIPLLIATPVVWMALEYARTIALTGFGMALLAHTQYQYPSVIQVADLAGAYGLSFLIVLVAAALCRALPCEKDRWAAWPIGLATGVIALVLGYGAWRTHGDYLRPGPRIAIVQGNVAQTLKRNVDRTAEVVAQHVRLSALVAVERPDVIIWPETMWRYPVLVVEPGVQAPADESWTIRELNQAAWGYKNRIARLARDLDVPLLLGVDEQWYGPQDPRRYNAAILVLPNGETVGRYHKIHRVMFGEYIPLAETFPWIYGLTPLAGGIQAGQHGQTPLPLGNWRLAPSICFESTVPHLIRRQVAEGRRVDQEPDLLVNLTNDGWFWGASELDLHLACAVFRAVECRKPMIVAANTGLSAWIDSDGRQQWTGPRQDEATFVAATQIDSRTSPYVLLGDWPGGICLAASLMVGLIGYRRGRKIDSPSVPSSERQFS